MKTRPILISLVTILLALILGAGVSAASAVPPLQNEPPAAEAGVAPEATPALLKGPHVQNVAKTAATIIWEASETSTSYLHYRKVGDAAWINKTVTTSAVLGKYIFTTTLTGLLSNKNYEYQISLNNSTWLPATAAVFITAPGTTATYLISAWSDSQPNPEGSWPPNQDIFKTILAKMQLQNPRISLSTGDRVERGQCYEDWKPDYFDPAASLVQNACVFPGFGNHEDDIRTTNCAAGTQRLWYDDLFSWPGKTAGTHWYAFSYGCVRYVALDTTVDFWTDATGTQLRWLKQELASSAFSSAKWQIVYFHHPPYSCSATSGDEAEIRPKIQTYLVPLFTQYGVDVVVNGHRHNYERSLRDGVYYIVSGGGGASLRNFESSCTSINPYSQKRVLDWNFITLKFKCSDPPSLTLKAISDEGATIDTLTLTQTAPGETCKSFQDGVAPTTSYGGSRDAYVHEHYPATLYGAATSLNADGDDPNGSGHQVDALLKWDISAIPSGSTVTSAKIDLWVTNHSHGIDYEIYKITKSWVETTVKWNNRPTYAATVLGAMAPAAAPANYATTLNSAGKTAVQSWVTNPSANYGFYISDPANTVGFDFDSSEGATPARRPKLTVCYTAAAGSSATEAEEIDFPAEAPEALDAYTGVTSFSGATFQGLGEGSAPLAGVTLRLYGRNEGEEAPGALLATSISDEAGAFGFETQTAWANDFFVLAVESPAGLINAGNWTIDGSETGAGSYEWYRPQADFYAGEFYFDAPSAPSEPLPAPETAQTLWLPIIGR